MPRAKCKQKYPVFLFFPDPSLFPSARVRPASLAMLHLDSAGSRPFLLSQWSPWNFPYHKLYSSAPCKYLGTHEGGSGG